MKGRQVRFARSTAVTAAVAVHTLVALLIGLAAGPAAAAAVPDDPLSPELRAWLADNGPLRVGWSPTSAPIAIVTDGEVTGGYGPSLWDLAAGKLGVPLEHVVLDSAQKLDEAIPSGEVDVIGARAARPGLAAVAAPAGPPLAWVEVLFVAPPGTARVPSSGTVATVPGSVFEGVIADQFPELTYEPHETPVAGLRAVAAGETDVFLGPNAFIGYLLRQQEISLQPVGEAVSTAEVTAWAEPGGAAASIAEVVTSELTPTEKSVIHVQWTGFDLTDPSDRAALPSWLGWTLVGLLGGLVLLGVFALVLRRRVRAATAELREVNEGLEDVVEERTSELLQREQQLQRSNAALQRFASVAAHDLNGPLAAIKGLVEVARTRDLDVDERAQVLGNVQSSAAKLSDMVDAMLDDASSLGAGRAHMTGAELEHFLRDVVGPSVDAVGGRLEVDAPEGHITADGEVLRRAAVNLGDNAIKYAADDDGLTLRVAVVPLDGQWRMVVEDDGPGIPTEDRERVFERGRRLTREERGLGLGLAVLRDVVIGAGGEIHVEDAALGGARFVVTLPRTSSDDAAS